MTTFIREPEDEPDVEESFAYDLFLACVAGLVARKLAPHDVYTMAKDYAQTIYDHATDDRTFDEVMDQTWPTKDS